MQRIEEDFSGFFKSDAMLLHVALGFVLIPLKPDVLKFVFDVQRIAFPYDPSNPTARMISHHGFGQRKANRGDSAVQIWASHRLWYALFLLQL